MALIQCKKCDEIKSEFMFTRCKHSITGRRKICLPCDRGRNPDGMIALKTCKICRITKYSSLFARSALSKDGRQAKCALCTKERVDSNKPSKKRIAYV